MPVVYNTNMLNHWRQPSDIRWHEVLKTQGEDATLARLVIPLQVIDELDRQKYGPKKSDLARKAATAIRFLERAFKDTSLGQAVRLHADATLEVWVDNLHPETGARVLTDDIGMRLRARARRMGLKVVRLPEDHRKKGTALDEAPQQ